MSLQNVLISLGTPIRRGIFVCYQSQRVPDCQKEIHLRMAETPGLLYQQVSVAGLCIVYRTLRSAEYLHVLHRHILDCR